MRVGDSIPAAADEEDDDELEAASCVDPAAVRDDADAPLTLDAAEFNFDAPKPKPLRPSPLDASPARPVGCEGMPGFRAPGCADVLLPEAVPAFPRMAAFSTPL